MVLRSQRAINLSLTPPHRPDQPRNHLRMDNGLCFPFLLLWSMLFNKILAQRRAYLKFKALVVHLLVPEFLFHVLLISCSEGELVDLIDDFSDGRIQFAFAKVNDPNTALPKYVLIAWCGEGVPERTKGYFTSHLAAVSKVLHVGRFSSGFPL